MGTNTTSGVGGELGGVSTSQRRIPTSVANSFWDIQTLKAAPKAETLKASVVKSDSGDITLREIRYETPGAGNEKMMIFAYYALPAGKRGGRLPAIISVHGGGGLSDVNAALHWAKRGFAAVSMDLPGKAGEARKESRSEGPDMLDDNIFKVTPSPKNSYLYAAVNTVSRAISFLVDQKEVDPTRIGVIGYSWGGVITLITSGIDDRVSAACDVFGAGYIPDESIWVPGPVTKLSAAEKKIWREHFDPSSYLKSLHGRVMFVGATQDIYYPMRSFIKTYQAADGEKTLHLIPNKNHAYDEADVANMNRWFDYALKDGPGFASLKVKKSGGGIEVSARGKRPIVAVSLVTTAEKDFTKAVWEGSEVKGKDGVWKVDLPKGAQSYYVQATDDNGAVIADQVKLAGK